MRIASFHRSFWVVPLFVLAFLLSTALEAQAVPVVAVTQNNNLLVFDSATPGNIVSFMPITGLQGGETILAIDFRPRTGQLFALGSTGRLYFINPDNATVLGYLPLTADPNDATDPFTAFSGTSFGFDFLATVDQLRVISDTDQNLRINLRTGEVNTDVALGYAVGDPNFGQNPRATGAAHTDNFPGATEFSLYDIDTNLDILITQNNPNTGALKTVGALGVSVDDVLGFDIAPGTGSQPAYAAMRNPSELGSSGFYTINLATGAATLIGNIGGGELIRGISIKPVVSKIYALTGSNKLLLFSSTAPGVILSTVSITGLQGGETVVGMDFRPRTGQLYGIGSTNRMYTINPTTGQATEVTGGAPFVLNGTAFGVDFKPSFDYLRVVSDTGQNLRLSPNTGGLNANDTAHLYHPSDINFGENPNVVAIAYTNPVDDSPATTLFGIDSELNILVRQGGEPDTGGAPTDSNSANSGRLFTIGNLSMDTSEQAGLDIAPGSNLAFASLHFPNFPLYSLNVVNLRFGNSQSAGATTSLGLIGGGESVHDIAVAPQGTFQFSAQSYAVMENCTGLDITVKRDGDLSQPASVDYATTDASVLDESTDRSDYTAAYGTLFFSSGESSKTFRLLVNEDSKEEKLQGAQGETLSIQLSNPTNGYFLGLQNTTSVLIIDDPVEPVTNAIDDNSIFVSQHYHDFLNRDPDAAGLQFWTQVLNDCGGNQTCLDQKRVQVSAAFFLSIEFQETGYLVYRTHTAAFGPTFVGNTVPILNQTFQPDVQRISRGVVVGVGNWQAQLEANKVAYFDQFVTRSGFKSSYPTILTTAQYVDGLNTNAGGALSQAERDALVSGLNNGSETRATVLRKVAEDADLKSAQFNKAFVLMQYFGYLRREPFANPDINFDGYNFWLNKLNSFNGDFVKAEMVKSFLLSGEYRNRFAH